MENTFYRTFIAVPLEVDSDFTKGLMELRAALERERISWVKPENFHVTLRFLGDTPLQLVEEIGHQLSLISFPDPSQIRLSGPRYFGPAKRPRILYMDISRQDLFRKMKASVDHALKNSYEDEAEKSFHAHLTLGRIRSLQQPGHFFELIQKFEPALKSELWVEGLVYYRSILTERGPDYHKLKEFSFRKS